MPTADDNAKPGIDLSIRYHSTGLTNASVKDTCNVDCHGTLLCLPSASVTLGGWNVAYHCEGNPNKGTDASNSRIPNGAEIAVHR